MAYRVSYRSEVRTKLSALSEQVLAIGLGKVLSAALLELQNKLLDDPVNFGEEMFRYRSLPMSHFLGIHRFLSVSYAVEEIQKVVLVANLKLLSNHPFPDGFDKILND